MTKKTIRGAVLVSLLAGFSCLAAFAQGGPRPVTRPGEAVPAAVLEREAGPAGKALAGYLGVRPVLVVYWRPGDPVSEAALADAIAGAREAAPEAAVLPVAVLAAGQPESSVTERLKELGLASAVEPVIDRGDLAVVLGVRRAPSFALIDAGGVLRLVGGSDISQANKDGVSILQALALAAKGKAVPTLGVLEYQPAYRLLGSKLPGVAVTELDGSTWRRLTDFLVPGKRLLLFYWSPICPHCKRALPVLGRWYEEHRPDDLVVVDVARADAEALRRAAAPLIESYPWKHLLDVRNAAGKTLLVTRTPTSFLVSGDGEILAVQVGETEDWSAWLGGTRAGSGASR
ncbi:MAG: TlpA family protein disulfide reductase [Acidobacteria bacterium]|nr:MAG: TlpA family protein disulfide reductase [Acidobacteriota bacterium]